jgi:hydroxymethylglutaryl-CoA synthase
MSTSNIPGLSGISLYVPRLRVRLRDWCEWTGAAADKVEAVVGRSFRVCAPDENVYTMAANAALRLIRRYEIDPSRVGLLALGTESSTDNAAGAVILKGMLDEALPQLGLPPLSRACEVPEIKHACLGGIYATKAAARYVAADGRDRVAIVVSADVAEYERGSSGEQTQGAGAVAFLVEAQPKLLEIDLARGGSAASYRGIDFRKPVRRHFVPGYAARTNRLHDFPVFNGKYSTACYTDAVVHALDEMIARGGFDRARLFDDVRAIVMHRPYAMMPIQALGAALTWTMARDPLAHGRLRELCELSGVALEDVIAEVERRSDLFALVREHGPAVEHTPALSAVAKAVRATPGFKQLVADKLGLGSDLVRDLGNLYTASLPAWIGAAVTDALARGEDLTDRTLLAIGYGSGDAAEAFPLRGVPGWRGAAERIGFADALADAVDLDRAQYEALHDGAPVADLAPVGREGFVVDRIGDRMDAEHQDVGIEYYAYVA